MAKNDSGDRSPKMTGSTFVLKGTAQNGGMVLGSTDQVGEYNLMTMKNSSQAKAFRGAGGKVSMDNMSSSIGGKVRS